MTPEPRLIFEMRGQAEFLADRRSEGHSAVEHDRDEAELLAAWDAQVEALAILEGERDDYKRGFEAEVRMGKRLHAEKREAERRLAEATGALRRIVEGGPYTAQEIAREALRAEPAEDGT